jgi:hypothetical protein
MGAANNYNMLFDWKIIATVFAVFAVILGFLTTSPVVSSFFNNIFGTFSGTVDLNFFKETRNVPFSLNMTNYQEMSFSVKSPANITIEPKEFTATVTNANIGNVSKIIITNFKGSVSISDNKILLDGDFEKLAADSTSFVSNKIKGTGVFYKAVLDSVGLKSLNLVSSNGILTINDTEIRFVNKNVDINSPFGTFYFEKGLFVGGYANSISVPADKIKTTG